MEKKIDLLIFTQEGCLPCLKYIPKAMKYADAAGLTYRVVDVNSDDAEDRRLSRGVEWTPTFVLRGVEVELSELSRLARRGRA